MRTAVVQRLRARSRAPWPFRMGVVLVATVVSIPCYLQLSWHSMSQITKVSPRMEKLHQKQLESVRVDNTSPSRTLPLRGGCVPTYTHSAAAFNAQHRRAAAPPHLCEADLSGKGGKSGNNDRKSSIYSSASLHQRPIFFHSSAILPHPPLPFPPENPYPTSLPHANANSHLACEVHKGRREDTTRAGGKGIQWEYSGNTVGIQWEYSGNTVRRSQEGGKKFPKHQKYMVHTRYNTRYHIHHETIHT